MGTPGAGGMPGVGVGGAMGGLGAPGSHYAYVPSGSALHGYRLQQQGGQMRSRAFPTSAAGGAGGGTVTQNQQAAVGMGRNHAAGSAGSALPLVFPEPWRQQGWGDHMIQDPNRQHSLPTTAQAVSGAVAVQGSHRDAAAVSTRPLPLPAEPEQSAKRRDLQKLKKTERSATRSAREAEEEGPAKSPKRHSKASLTRAAAAAYFVLFGESQST
uniref:Uncharacterized protein n=1 Tax=Chromera velia CCMP2878 TaxID=1169474 RepID=A0A0G4GI85_9ALVE|eukprot:Cvel_22027.t1-p1 / transcript=Cvel_22027.t1 / gene=Cvel_22027 / organism=Chromera_velia_CCMP2878 / gene_product=hypothetical protein / transcript_product=hypothetical protein / location=Cvel_scaffold2125:29196-32774(+) / protein_length=212 / sequence_SO=supercontig / SO=protein_coding / is_pseudo=false